MSVSRNLNFLLGLFFGDAGSRQHDRVGAVPAGEHVAALGRSEPVDRTACDLRRRDRGHLRMVLRAAAEGADARGHVPAMAVLVSRHSGARVRANSGAQLRTGESRATTSGFRVHAKSRAPE